jgi:hypothetical protein
MSLYYGVGGARGSEVGWGTMLQVDLIPKEVIWFFIWHNPPSRTMTLGLSQPLAEVSTRKLPGGEVRPEHKSDNLTAIYEPIV